MGYLIMKKNQRSKISCYCPFNNDNLIHQEENKPISVYIYTERHAAAAIRLSLSYF